MKQMKTISIILAGFFAMMMLCTSCGKDNDVLKPSTRSLLAELDSSLIYFPDSGLDSLYEYTQLKACVVDKDGDDILPQLVGGGKFNYDWFVEYRGGHFYHLPMGLGLVPPEISEDMASHWPEGYIGGASFGHLDDRRTCVILTYLQPEHGKKEAVTYHWTDGTTNTVEFMAIPNDEYPDKKPRYYMVYFVDGKQTSYPIVFVK